MAYERADLWIGIAFVMIGAIAMMAFAAQVFIGRPEFGNFTDAAGVAAGLEAYAGRLPAVLFAIALIDASVIGAMAVSLSTAYAIGDVMALRHSLHRKPTEAKGFYAVYCGLIVVAAALVLTPGAPLGLLTNAVQALAGVLLPSATVFLLLLCNDRAVLGPWVNGKALNAFTGAVIAVLVTLSVVSDRFGAVPRRDRREGGRLHCRRLRRRRLRRDPRNLARRAPRARPSAARFGDRGAAARNVADAAARETRTGQAVAVEPDVDGRAARLSHPRRRAGADPHRHAGDRRVLTPAPGAAAPGGISRHDDDMRRA